MRLLLVEDEIKTGDYLQQGLTETGFLVTLVRNGLDGHHLAMTETFDLLVLDVMLPDVDGWRIVQSLREAGRQTPVLFLTARDSVDDRVKGLELGADDYMTKPFSVRELVARIRAVLRRSRARSDATILEETFTYLGLEIDSPSCTVKVDNNRVSLSSREFKLLQFLTRRPGRVYSREQLLDHVWGDETFVEPRTVDVHISRLRAAIEKDKEHPKYILTVRGLGYKFNDISPEQTS
jgi:two-component system copper resistance phosphate regulon response regulator CusR